MFAMSARVSPCSARVDFSSLLRVMTSVPSSRATLTLSWNVRTSSPLGPFTRSVRPSIFTSTPCGIVTGMRPIRLIANSIPDPELPLPDFRQDFAAQTASLGLASGHDAGRGRDDRDAETAQHAWHLGLARV